MAWVCRDCGRTDEDPPPSCAVCGGEVVPAPVGETGSRRFSVRAVRDRLLAPMDADTSLVDIDPRVGILFRAIVALTAVLLAVLVGTVLLG